MELLEQISQSLQAGKAKDVKRLVQAAVSEGISHVLSFPLFIDSLRFP